MESSHSGGPGGYEVYLTHPDGGSLYVNVAAQAGSTASAQQLIDAGRRVAENVTFPGTTTVTPAFGLGKLPDGLRMCTFDVEKDGPSGPRTSYSVGTCSTLAGWLNWSRTARRRSSVFMGSPAPDIGPVPGLLDAL